MTMTMMTIMVMTTMRTGTMTRTNEPNWLARALVGGGVAASLLGANLIHQQTQLASLMPASDTPAIVLVQATPTAPPALLLDLPPIPTLAVPQAANANQTNQAVAPLPSLSLQPIPTVAPAPPPLVFAPVAPVTTSRSSQ